MFKPIRFPRKDKPHIYKHRKHWVCRDTHFFAQAAKPITAYRAYLRRKEWARQGYPGVRMPISRSRACI